MNSSNFDTCFISCGCNKNPHAADWGRNELICFASCNAVAVYDPTYAGNAGKIIYTLHGHKEKVTSVRWLKNFRETVEHEMLSTSADGTSILWSWDEKEQAYTQEHLLQGHTNIVNIGDGFVRIPARGTYKRGASPILLATASVDSTVRIYLRDSEKSKIQCTDILDWGSGFCVDVRLAPLPETDLALLACAADDNNVHLFAETRITELNDTDTSSVKFVRTQVLQGHEDWVRCMDFTLDVYNCLYLATGSQDTYIRVYTISRKKSHEERHHRKKVVELSRNEDIKPEEKMITVSVELNSYHFSVVLETILAGHEGWVYGVSWHPPEYTYSEHAAYLDNKGGVKTQKLKLLSSSMDKTMVIWSPNLDGAWTEEARLGEVGGNTLGFYGGKIGHHGRALMAHGYQGSFHIWRLDKETSRWEPAVVVGGHSDGVTDLAWDMQGNYILSVGNDQTARLHAPWVRDHGNKVTWHELARPQIHGYDLSCVALLSSFKYVSGAEEKVIRAFSAPSNFIDNFKRISGVNIDAMAAGEVPGPQGAAVPALGLSNKPVFEAMHKEGFIIGDEYPDFYFSPIHLKKPPTEENLLQNTLWPEMQKLYGHGYEVYCVAARHDGLVLASASKASSKDHAAVILWNGKTWLQIQKLVSHTLTVTQLAFSPDGRSLLSVSRDRRWSVFNVNADGKTYTLEASTDAKTGLHTRVIWTCAWTFDSAAFATGSRDGKVGFWERPTSAETTLLTSVDLGGSHSITALAFAPVLRRSFNILAIGFESGAVHLYRYLERKVESLWVVLDDHQAHHLTVKRLAFRPVVGRAGVSPEDQVDQCDILQLASCGLDHMVKVYDIFLHLL